MEFDAGDYVVHPSYGVGNIVRLEEKRLAEADLRLYYVLAVENSTVWVPVQVDWRGGSAPGNAQARARTISTRIEKQADGARSRSPQAAGGDQ